MTNAADVLIAILHARDKGESPALILAYDSPLMDAARDVLRPQAPYVDSEIATLQARIAELEVEEQLFNNTFDAQQMIIEELREENQRLRDALAYIEDKTGQRFIEQAAQRALLGGGENGC